MHFTVLLADFFFYLGFPIRNQSMGFPIRSPPGTPLGRGDCDETLVLSLRAEMPGVNYLGKDCVSFAA